MTAKSDPSPEENGDLSNFYAMGLLLIALLIKAGVVLAAILYAGIGLGPDEAQYWTWSQQLAFGYYSKPPGIAWQIAGGTALFGNTELGVRFGALLIGSALPVAVYALARAVPLSRVASLWAAIMMMWSPLGLLSSFLSITDGGMVLLWTCASILVARSLKKENVCSYYALGACIAIGALFKWLMYEFWFVPVVLACFLPSWRSWHLLGGMAVSLLGLLPSVVWNAQNQWATFRHVGNTMWTQGPMDVGATGLIKGNFFDFLGAQAILLSPILFVLFVVAAVSVWRRRQTSSWTLLLCGGLSAGILGIYLLIAVFKKMQGNWVDFAFPAATVLIAWRAWERSWRLRPWLIGGVILSFSLCIFALFLPYLQSEGLLKVPYKMSPFKHNLGWDNLRLELQAAGYDPDKHFLVADKYQTTSILNFYAAKQKRTYFLNLQEIRKNQYSYWPSMAKEQVGKTAYFVVIENTPLNDPKWIALEEKYRKELSPFFAAVRFLGIRPIYYVDGHPVKAAMTFKGIDYNGALPEEKEIY